MTLVKYFRALNGAERAVRKSTAGAVVPDAEKENGSSIDLSAKWLRSSANQRFREPEGCRAQPSSDLERIARTCKVFSSAIQILFVQYVRRFEHII